MSRSRSLLHINKLTDFKNWLKTKGWFEVPCGGFYEVLRMRHQSGGHPLIVYSKQDAKEHYTIHGIAYNMFRNWQDDRKVEKKTKYMHNKETKSLSIAVDKEIDNLLEQGYEEIDRSDYLVIYNKYAYDEEE